MEAAKLLRLTYFSQICHFPCLSARWDHTRYDVEIKSKRSRGNQPLCQSQIADNARPLAWNHFLARLQIYRWQHCHGQWSLVHFWLKVAISINIFQLSGLLIRKYSRKNIQRFWHKIAAEVWDWCCGMILVLIETGQVSTLGSAESPSKSSSHLSQSSTTSSERVPEFPNRHKNDSNQWKIIHRMVCRGNIKMTEPLARPLLPRAARV